MCLTWASRLYVYAHGRGMEERGSAYILVDSLVISTLTIWRSLREASQRRPRYKSDRILNFENFDLSPHYRTLLVHSARDEFALSIQ